MEPDYLNELKERANTFAESREKMILLAAQTYAILIQDRKTTKFQYLKIGEV